MFCSIYCNWDKTGVKKEGDLVQNKVLAKTLQYLQKNDVHDFYNGTMAKSLISEIQAKGGKMTLEDLNSYEVIESEPFKIDLKNADLQLVSASVPFGGPVLGGIISIIDEFNIHPNIFSQDKSLQWHRVVEAFKHTYGIRYSMGDPEFVPNVEHVVKLISSGHFAKTVKPKINDNHTFNDPVYYGAKFYNTSDKTTSTSHVAVLSPAKDAVSVTSTINFHFGAKFMSDSTGIVFNNEMNDFAILGLFYFPCLKITFVIRFII